MFLEYIWVDGSSPGRLLSKTYKHDAQHRTVEELPNFYRRLPKQTVLGKHTRQPKGKYLVPVASAADPFRGSDSLLILCQVQDDRGVPHTGDTRVELSKILVQTKTQSPVASLTQEYYIISDGTKHPLGFPVDEDGDIREDLIEGPGQYYCSVGGRLTYGRDIAERHLQMCTAAGLNVIEMHADHGPGQWSFTVKGCAEPTRNPQLVDTADQLLLCRWILERVTEEHRDNYGHRVYPSWEGTPVVSNNEWNESRLSVQFSTQDSRSQGGITTLLDMLRSLDLTTQQTSVVYGYGGGFPRHILDDKTTPAVTIESDRLGAGSLEDSRPCGSADPYAVLARLVSTCCLRLDVPVVSLAEDS